MISYQANHALFILFFHGFEIAKKRLIDFSMLHVDIHFNLSKVLEENFFMIISSTFSSSIAHVKNRHMYIVQCKLANKEKEKLKHEGVSETFD